MPAPTSAGAIIAGARTIRCTVHTTDRHRWSSSPCRESTAIDYRGESGETITATYPSADSATVRYRGHTHEMDIAASGSGTRYVGDGLEWWTKGSDTGAEGTLFRRASDGTTGEIVERCSPP